MTYPKRVTNGPAQRVYSSEFSFVKVRDDNAKGQHKLLTIVENGDTQCHVYIEQDSAKLLLDDLEAGTEGSRLFIIETISESVFFSGIPKLKYFQSKKEANFATKALHDKFSAGDRLTDDELTILIGYYKDICEIKGAPAPGYELMMADANHRYNQLKGFKKARAVTLMGGQKVSYAHPSVAEGV